MQYQGGKSRLHKHIVPIIQEEVGNVYLEPFVGGASIVSAIQADMRIANDAFYPLIALYHKMQEGVELPDTLTKEEYMMYKDKVYTQKDKHMEAFVGIGCSFGGKLWGGYASNKKGYNYCLAAKNSLTKKMATMQDVMFTSMDYRRLNPKNMTIYCDPPYAGTTGYKGTPEFNIAEFWDTMRQWAKQGNTIFVSEYTAPDDIEVVWEHDFNKNMDNVNTGVKKVTERLYRLMKGRGE